MVRGRRCHGHSRRRAMLGPAPSPARAARRRPGRRVRGRSRRGASLWPPRPPFRPRRGDRDRGKIGLVFANDAGQNTVVAPHGGAEPRLATNPIAIGIPRREPPHLVLDMATSATSHGGLVASRAAGRPDEPGWARGDALLPARCQRASASRSSWRPWPACSHWRGDIGDPAEVDYQGILLLVLDVERFLLPEAFLDGIER